MPIVYLPNLPNGPSIYDVQKISFLNFLPLSTCVHMRLHEPDPPPLCGRPHSVDMKYIYTHRSLETASTMTFLKCEIRLYDCNLFNTVLLVIFITNLYRQKFPLFIRSKDEILV